MNMEWTARQLEMLAAGEDMRTEFRFILNPQGAPMGVTTAGWVLREAAQILRQIVDRNESLCNGRPYVHLSGPQP